MPELFDALDITEPDDATLRASELESDSPTSPCAIVVLVGDRRYDAPGDNTDEMVVELLREVGYQVDGVDLVLTLGGTGVGPRDKTPEATRAVIDKVVPGVSQALRASGQACGAVDACTSRGICGVSGSTVVVNLASSRQAIRDGVSTAAPLVRHLIDELNQHSV